MGPHGDAGAAKARREAVADGGPGLLSMFGEKVSAWVRAMQMGPSPGSFTTGPVSDPEARKAARGAKP